MKDLHGYLQNYHTFVEKIDALCSEITEQCSDDLACRRGCDACCRHFSIFWVEAVSLASFVANLPVKQAAYLRNRVQSLTDQNVCPLLVDGECLLYASRPIICRTHGLPILTRNETSHGIDFCPLNFTQAETIPGHLVINLDQLNTTLVAINALFVSRYFNGNPPPTERLSIADALFLKI